MTMVSTVVCVLAHFEHSEKNLLKIPRGVLTSTTCGIMRGGLQVLCPRNC
jgi:hypothetical protein